MVKCRQNLQMTVNQKQKSHKFLATNNVYKENK